MGIAQSMAIITTIPSGVIIRESLKAGASTTSVSRQDGRRQGINPMARTGSPHE